MQVKLSIVDIDRIYVAVNQLANVNQNKLIKQGLKDASNIFIKQGKANLKARLKGKNTGNLLKSFKGKLKKNKLGVLAGFSNLGAHAHLVDEGTATRSTNAGANRGLMTGNNFWTDSINQSESTAIDAVFTGIERAMQKIMNRN